MRFYKICEIFYSTLYIVESIFEIKNSLLFHFGDYFLVPKTPVLVIDKIYVRNWLCSTISSGRIVFMNKTYARNRFY